MAIISKDEVPGIIQGVTEAILVNGSWLFPVGLLVVTFLLKSFMYREITGFNFYKSILILPIEVKTVACSFIFASAVVQPTDAIGLVFIGLAWVIVLSISIGFFNYLKVEQLDASKTSKAKVYFCIAGVISILMLNFSIVVMESIQDAMTAQHLSEVL